MLLAGITIIGLLVLPALLAGLCKFLLKVARGEEVVIADSSRQALITECGGRLWFTVSS